MAQNERGTWLGRAAMLQSVGVSERELIDAIESTMFVYPTTSGLTQDLGIPGLRGRVTKIAHPLTNLAGDARFSEREADAMIAKVRERYGGAAFGWLTGPSSRPADLSRRLTVAGLTKAADIAGLALTDLAAPMPTNPRIRVEEVPPARLVAESEMVGRAYGIPSEVARFFNEMIAANVGRLKTRTYFAYLDGGAPIAWSYLVYVPDSPIVLLGGAATLEEHRGHGAYTALVARRLADARADGRGAAIVQADRATSAPICVRLGFREVCALE